jgi:hypothetical protein
MCAKLRRDADASRKPPHIFPTRTSSPIRALVIEGFTQPALLANRSDRVAVVDDTADGEFGHFWMSPEQSIHALRRTLPTRCEIWHWFMTLEVLAADRKHDKHGDHDRRASMASDAYCRHRHSASREISQKARQGAVECEQERPFAGFSFVRTSAASRIDGGCAEGAVSGFDTMPIPLGYPATPACWNWHHVFSTTREPAQRDVLRPFQT